MFMAVSDISLFAEQPIRCHRILMKITPFPLKEDVFLVVYKIIMAMEKWEITICLKPSLVSELAIESVNPDNTNASLSMKYASATHKK